VTPSGPTVPDLLGESWTLLEAKERLSLAARVDRPVLILGERGTGKELAAARLHYLSRRWQNPYVTLNCAALAPGLVDAELVGHEAGAFTGARRRRPGRFEAADTGTIFLDEISHLGLGAQARILRVVEYGSFQLVGSAAEKKVDARVVAATNADLRRMCRDGGFLPDLWDRLSFEVITLPPLRDRPGDVSLLAHYFGARMAQELGREVPPVFSVEALALLEGHPWPGNVRELKNVVERAVYRSAPEETLIGPGLVGLDSGAYPPGLTGPAAAGAGAPAGPPGAAPGASAAPESPALPGGRSFPLGPGEFDRLTADFGRRLVDMAMAEARIPLPTQGTPRRLMSPWTDPSSPWSPWRAGKATSRPGASRTSAPRSLEGS
jgi:psp operon transcriptional activator